MAAAGRLWLLTFKFSFNGYQKLSSSWALNTFPVPDGPVRSLAPLPGGTGTEHLRRPGRPHG